MVHSEKLGITDEASRIGGLDLPNDLSANNDEEWMLVTRRKVSKLRLQAAYARNEGQKGRSHHHAERTRSKAALRVTKQARKK